MHPRPSARKYEGDKKKRGRWVWVPYGAVVVLSAAVTAAVVAVPSGPPPTTTATAPAGLFLAPVPGALNPAVTQATIRQTICVPGWTATIRPPSTFTAALKTRQIFLYHLPPGSYEEDHLVSLELGGAPANPANLWPEPQPRAGQVDLIENQLKHQICAGTITLAQAQTRITVLKHTLG